MASAASTSSIPRFLLPQGPFVYRLRLSSHRLAPTNGRSFPRSHVPSLRPASSTSSASSSQSKPRLLEKPSKYTAPSHSSRLVAASAPRPTYGPDLSAAQKFRQQTASYPHTMPPEGTWTHWLIHSRAFHTTFSLSVLLFFAIWTLWLQFKHDSPYYSMVPSLGEFFSRPLQGLGRVVEIYKLQAEYTTEETKRRREKWVEDARKAKAYRVLQGLEPLEGQGLEVKSLVERIRGSKSDEGWEERLLRMHTGQVVDEEQGSKGEKYVDFQGRKRAVKKWFGIW